MKLPKMHGGGFLETALQKMQYADLFLVLFSIIYANRIYQWFIDRGNAKCRNLLVLIAICWILSTMFSLHKDISRLDTAGLLMLITLFILINKLTISHNYFLLFNKINVYFAACVALFGILTLIVYANYSSAFLDQFFMPRPNDNAAVLIDRMSSTLTLPEMLITYLHVALVSGAIVYVHEKKRAVLICIAFIIIAALLAYSRSLTGFIATSSLILFAFRFKKTIFRLAVKLFALFAIVFFAIAILLSFYRIYSVSSENGTAENRTQIGHEKRFFMADAAFQIFKSSPIWGGGPGSYTYEARKYINFDSISHIDFLIARDLANENAKVDPHSLYLGVISENGLLGIFSLGAFILYMIFFNHKIISTYDHKVLQTHQILNAGLIGFLITGLFVDILSMRHFWVLIALIYTWKSIYREQTGNNKANLTINKQVAL